MIELILKMKRIIIYIMNQKKLIGNIIYNRNELKKENNKNTYLNNKLEDEI